MKGKEIGFRKGEKKMTVGAKVEEKISRYIGWNDKIIGQIDFILQNMDTCREFEKALMQLQIDLRSCIKTEESTEIQRLLEEADEKIIKFHKGDMCMDDLQSYLWGVKAKFRSLIIAEYGKLKRLKNLYSAIENMIFAGDSFPDFILPEKLRDLFK